MSKFDKSKTILYKRSLFKKKESPSRKSSNKDILSISVDNIINHLNSPKTSSKRNVRFNDNPISDVFQLKKYSPKSKPIFKSTPLIIQKSIDDPIHKSIEKPIKKTIEKPIEKVIQKPIEKVIENPIEKVIKKSTEKVIKKSIEKPIEKPIEKTIEKPIEKVIKKPIEKVIEKPIEKVIKKPIEKVIEKPIEKVIENLNEELDEKPIEINIQLNSKKENTRKSPKRIKSKDTVSVKSYNSQPDFKFETQSIKSPKSNIYLVSNKETSKINNKIIPKKLFKKIKIQFNLQNYKIRNQLFFNPPSKSSNNFSKLPIDLRLPILSIINNNLIIKRV